MKRMRKLLAILMTLAMLAFALPLADAEEKDMASFSMETENMIMNSSGLDLHAWEEQVAAAKQSGRMSVLTEEDMVRENPKAVMHSRDGRIYMIDGMEAIGTIHSAMDAYRTVYRLHAILGGSEEADMRLWSVITLPGQQKVYVFQQIFEGMTVVASTVKIVTDAQGTVKTVFSSLSSGIPDSTGVESITAAEAETIVEEYMTAIGCESSVLHDYTARAVCPVDEDEEFENTGDGKESTVAPDRLVWIVYSGNPAFADVQSVVLPYLAHYVGMDGTYLFSCAVTIPGDTAVQGGYPAEYTFAFMEKKEWTGEVTGVDGTPYELTVPVMRDMRTGMYYLGDPERRIAVADFASMIYGGSEVCLVAGETNEGWDDEDLITFASMLRAWDFYADLGWYGPDGIGTPMLMLRGMCTEQGEDIYNAAYGGLYDGWQIFAYGKDTYLGEGLDVIAHEFTHGVTTAMMNTNLYLDDYGAINEAMSDILGNLCESLIEGREEQEWLIGENAGNIMRSMLNPHDYQQPEFVWDIYYGPHSSTPNDVNDRGGVHSNSSILNRVAARLCTEAGMTLDQARDFWLTVSAGMTAKMDYTQIPELLNWAMDVSGLNGYRAHLNAFVADSRMTVTSVPEELPEGYRLVRLNLPEYGDVADEHWMVLAYQIDLKEIRNRLKAVADFAGKLGNMDGFMENLKELTEALKIPHLIGALMDGDIEKADEIIANAMSGLVSQHMTWRMEDENAAVMVLRELPTVYMIMNISPETQDVQGMAVLLGSRWYGMNMSVNNDGDGEMTADLHAEQSLAMLADIMLEILQLKADANHVQYGEGQNMIDLPTLGLDTIELAKPET